MPPSTLVSVLIVAAGKGVRAGGGLPKQYREIGSRSVLAHVVDAFATHAAVDVIQIVINPDDRHLYDRALAGAGAGAKVLPPVAGGATRQESVRAGLAALVAHGCEWVLVHDAARPFVDPGIIDRVIAGLRTHDGAIAAVPLADTLKRQDADGRVAGTVDRSGLWRAQTPQGFRLEKLLAAHDQAARAGLTDFTDDAGIAESAGLSVALVMGSESNRKLTTEEDIAMADRELRSSRTVGDEFRSATGFDVHRFTAGDHVWLCGVRVPHTAALEGHSDADVGLHALTDALLGTIGDGDIGQHFPPSDVRWRGAASHIFLAEAARLVAARGGHIVNCDVTLLCEAPRIGPHRDAMRARIAEILSLAVDRVSVKATTTEGLGFTGRREGIAAQAAATVRLPAPPDGAQANATPA